MASKYPHLEACCGGTINPETLQRFQRAMMEYQLLIRDLREKMGPPDGMPPCSQD